MKTTIESRRMYSVETSINGLIENFRIKFTEIIDIKSNSETIYSLQEDIDRLLDLKVKESMFFQPNRDNLKSKGIITRIR